MAQFDSVPVSGTEGRRFKSWHPGYRRRLPILFFVLRTGADYGVKVFRFPVLEEVVSRFAVPRVTF